MSSAPSLAIPVEGRLLLGAALGLIAALAIVAVFLAALAPTVRLALLIAIVLGLAASLRALGQQPPRLVLAADGTAELPGVPTPFRVCARRYGPLLVLSLIGPTGAVRVVLIRRLLGRAVERQLIARTGAS